MAGAMSTNKGDIHPALAGTSLKVYPLSLCPKVVSRSMERSHYFVSKNIYGFLL